ncbi:hypothetical protein BKA67DRAFT_584684 [Truncatella angustata]|uniref:Uncharacterized protein n=1 Tax=Truncatella angustata TaxID=152316 RepID=A0A9P8UBE1_9PEZI|nr:uncharacterized protein BKA67DRAFT_584684 [Truncatella angustata]KAH6645276.1 hypothetical protein BKA67DRAFT_584684 [Truncatella angustata]
MIEPVLDSHHARLNQPPTMPVETSPSSTWRQNIPLTASFKPHTSAITTQRLIKRLSPSTTKGSKVHGYSIM